MWVTTLTLLTTEVFVTHANAPLTPEGRRRLAVLVVGGVCITLIFRGSPVGLIITAQALTVLVAPFLGVLLLVMSNRRFLGDLRNRWWHNVFAAIGVVAICATSVRLITSLIG